jgi:hypothetical protein
LALALQIFIVVLAGGVHFPAPHAEEARRVRITTTIVDLALVSQPHANP